MNTFHVKCDTLDKSSRPELLFYLSKYLILFHVQKHVSFQISIPLHSHTVLISTSTWRLVGSAWFPSSIIFIQMTNELSWFTGQRRNGSIWYVVFLKHVFSSHSATELQQAGVCKLCLLFILKCATKLTGWSIWVTYLKTITERQMVIILSTLVYQFPRFAMSYKQMWTRKF